MFSNVNFASACYAETSVIQLLGFGSQSSVRATYQVAKLDTREYQDGPLMVW